MVLFTVKQTTLATINRIDPNRTYTLEEMVKLSNELGWSGEQTMKLFDMHRVPDAYKAQDIDPRKNLVKVLSKQISIMFYKYSCNYVELDGMDHATRRMLVKELATKEGIAGFYHPANGDDGDYLRLEAIGE